MWSPGESDSCNNNGKPFCWPIGTRKIARCPKDLDLGAWRLVTLPWAMARIVEMGRRTLALWSAWCVAGGAKPWFDIREDWMVGLVARNMWCWHIGDFFVVASMRWYYLISHGLFANMWSWLLLYRILLLKNAVVSLTSYRISNPTKLGRSI